MAAADSRENTCLHKKYDFTPGQKFIMIGLYTPNMIPSRNPTELQYTIGHDSISIIARK